MSCLTGVEVFHKSPGPGVMASANSFYTRASGVEKLCIMNTTTRSDIADTEQRRFSSDNGRSWSEPETVQFIRDTERGTGRTSAQPGFVDPVRDRLVTMVIDGILPTDDPLEGMTSWYLRYRVSRDGGHTDVVDEQVIQSGEHSPDHPCNGVWVGKNSMMMGDSTCRPIRTRRGEILVPVQVTPIGPDGSYQNPGGGYTYHDSAVLIGSWISGDRIKWDLSEFVRNDPRASTRGALEPTLIEMPDGAVMMVMRGSNDSNPSLPGYKWYSLSEDGGRTFGPIAPWTYTDGSCFYSPSSCSQLIEHSSKRIYWIGNISNQNPRGNWPRYPLVIGEVNAETGLLDRSTLLSIDDRRPGEDERMTLSNFMAHEDRQSGEIVLHVTRLFAAKYLDWTADSYLYRIEV